MIIKKIKKIKEIKELANEKYLVDGHFYGGEFLLMQTNKRYIYKRVRLAADSNGTLCMEDAYAALIDIRCFSRFDYMRQGYKVEKFNKQSARGLKSEVGQINQRVLAGRIENIIRDTLKNDVEKDYKDFSNAVKKEINHCGSCGQCKYLEKTLCQEGRSTYNVCSCNKFSIKLKSPYEKVCGEFSLEESFIEKIREEIGEMEGQGVLKDMPTVVIVPKEIQELLDIDTE